MKIGPIWRQRLFLIVLLLVFLGLWLILRPRPIYSHYLGANSPCPSDEEDRTFGGQKYRITWNWYICHKPVVEDVVLVRVRPEDPPRLMKIIAVTGEYLSMGPALNGKGFIFTARGRALGEVSRSVEIAGQNSPPLSLYPRIRGPVVGLNDVVAMAQEPFDSIRPGDYGAVQIDNLVAKAVLQAP